MEEMRVYKCERCSGRGQTVHDWDHYNNSGPFNCGKRPEWNGLGSCYKCKGKGFILINASSDKQETTT